MHPHSVNFRSTGRRASLSRPIALTRGRSVGLTFPSGEVCSTLTEGKRTQPLFPIAWLIPSGNGSRGKPAVSCTSHLREIMSRLKRRIGHSFVPLHIRQFHLQCACVSRWEAARWREWHRTQEHAVNAATSAAGVMRAAWVLAERPHPLARCFSSHLPTYDPRPRGIIVLEGS